MGTAHIRYYVNVPGKGICKIEECGKRVSARGWCGAHYRLWQRNGDPLARQKNWGRAGTPCNQCDRPRLGGGRGWCPLHYNRWRQGGEAALDGRRKQGKTAIGPFISAPASTSSHRWLQREASV